MNLYERSRDNLWTDEHISRQMLLAHLDLTNDAATRNETSVKNTVEWLSGEISQGASVLDLGCGPGIYAERLAVLGYSVTGIDLSQTSIEYAIASSKAKGLGITYRHGDYLDMLPQAKHDAAICIYCDFGALTPDEQVVFLTNCHQALNADGCLYFDVFEEKALVERIAGKTWSQIEGPSFWSDNNCYVLEETCVFAADKAAGCESTVLENGKSAKTFITWDTYYTEASIRRLLETNKFVVEQVRTDIACKNDFVSDRVLFVKARKT